MDFGAIYNWGQFRTLDATTPMRAFQVMSLDRTVWDYLPHGQREAERVFEKPSLVTISLAKTGTLGGNLDWNAEVSWGIGAQRQTLTCDWQHGVQLQVPATAIAVRALPYAPRATSMTATGQSLLLSAQVGIGSFSGIPVTLTRRLMGTGGLAPAGTIIAPPPDFARRVSVYPGLPGDTTLDPYASLRAEWVYPGGAHLCTVPGPTLAAGASMPIPGIAELQIRNISVAQTMHPVVV